MTVQSDARWLWAGAGGHSTTISPAPDLHIYRRAFYDQHNARWPWRMVTDFALLRRVLDGVDIRPMLAQRRRAGANGVRVLGAKAASDNPNIPSLFVLDPREDGIYNAADELFHLLRAEGMTCEFVIGADEQVFKRSPDEQRHHFETMYGVANSHQHVVLEAWNEWQQNMWGMTPADFRQPSGLVWSRGSGVSDGEPATPAGTHTTYHNDRGPEWPRKFKSNLELSDRYDRACLSNEPIRCDGEDWPVSDWFEAGTCAQLFEPGATFHSAQGRTSELWSPAVLERAEAFFQGMNAVGLDAQLGTYAISIPGGQGLRNYDELRTYGMIRGGEQWAIVLRPGPAYPWSGDHIAPATMNGWQISSQHGPRGTVVRLVR